MLEKVTYIVQFSRIKIEIEADFLKVISDKYFAPQTLCCANLFIFFLCTCFCSCFFFFFNLVHFRKKMFVTAQNQRSIWNSCEWIQNRMNRLLSRCTHKLMINRKTLNFTTFSFEFVFYWIQRTKKNNHKCCLHHLHWVFCFFFLQLCPRFVYYFSLHCFVHVFTLQNFFSLENTVNSSDLLKIQTTKMFVRVHNSSRVTIQLIHSLHFVFRFALLPVFLYGSFFKLFTPLLYSYNTKDHWRYQLQWIHLFLFFFRGNVVERITHIERWYWEKRV